jgi:hypothetical protein
MKKPSLCVEFDGVIHSNVSGWDSPTIIPDAPIEGAIDFLYNSIKDFEISIYSTKRSKHIGGIEAMQEWLYKYYKIWQLKQAIYPPLHLIPHIKWPTERPNAIVTLDSKDISFKGYFPSGKELLKSNVWAR